MAWFFLGNGVEYNRCRIASVSMMPSGLVIFKLLGCDSVSGLVCEGVCK